MYKVNMGLTLVEQQLASLLWGVVLLGICQLISGGNQNEKRDGSEVTGSKQLLQGGMHN